MALNAIKTDELYMGCEVVAVGPKLVYGSDDQATRKGVPAWVLTVSLGDKRTRDTFKVTVWQATAPEAAEGTIVRFQGVLVGASERGRLWITAESWAAKK